MYYTKTNHKLPLVQILWRSIFWIKTRHYFLSEMGLQSWPMLLLITDLLPIKSIPNPYQVFCLLSFSSVPSRCPLDRASQSQEMTTFSILLTQLRKKIYCFTSFSPHKRRKLLPKTNSLFHSHSLSQFIFPLFSIPVFHHCLH